MKRAEQLTPEENAEEWEKLAQEHKEAQADYAKLIAKLETLAAAES